MVRTKFTCQAKIDYSDGKRIDFTPVIGGSPENEQFFKLTPGGQIQIMTVNEEAAKQFDLGAQYYIDFSPASKDGQA